MGRRILSKKSRARKRNKAAEIQHTRQKESTSNSITEQDVGKIGKPQGVRAK